MLYLRGLDLMTKMSKFRDSYPKDNLR